MRVRFKVRTVLVLVAVVAIGLGIEKIRQRREYCLRMAAWHERVSHMTHQNFHLNQCLKRKFEYLANHPWLRDDSGMPSHPDNTVGHARGLGGAEIAISTKLSGKKNLRAAERPWVVVEPNPPEPPTPQ